MPRLLAVEIKPAFSRQPDYQRPSQLVRARLSKGIQQRGDAFRDVEGGVYGGADSQVGRLLIRAGLPQGVSSRATRSGSSTGACAAARRSAACCSASALRKASSSARTESGSAMQACAAGLRATTAAVTRRNHR